MSRPDAPRPWPGDRPFHPGPGHPPAGQYPPPRPAQYAQPHPAQYAQPHPAQYAQHPGRQDQHGQYPPPAQQWNGPPQRDDTPRPPRERPQPPRARFGALAWSAVILGIVGVVGSPLPLLNNLTAVVAGVGLILGVIALFGTRKVLAGIGVVLCIAAITFTVMAQNALTAEFDRQFGDLGEFGGGPEAMADVTAADCAIVDEGYGFLSAQGTVVITNSTAETQTYSTTVSVDDAAGNRLGEINSFTNSLAPGQSVTLSGMEASGLANENAAVGPATCRVADVTRLAG